MQLERIEWGFVYRPERGIDGPFPTDWMARSPLLLATMKVLIDTLSRRK
jgi:hypothetical protein